MKHLKKLLELAIEMSSRGLSRQLFSAADELSTFSVILMGTGDVLVDCRVYEHDIRLWSLTITQLGGTQLSKRTLPWDEIESISTDKLMTIYPHRIAQGNIPPSTVNQPNYDLE